MGNMSRIRRAPPGERSRQVSCGHADKAGGIGRPLQCYELSIMSEWLSKLMDIVVSGEVRNDVKSDMDGEEIKKKQKERR
jgi:hypothetical protein